MATTWIEPWELTGFNSSFPFLEPIHPLIYLSYLSVTLFFRKPYPQTRTQTREVVDAATSKPQSSLRCGTYIQIETSENPSIICFFFPFSFFLFADSLLIPLLYPWSVLLTPHVNQLPTMRSRLFDFSQFFFCLYKEALHSTFSGGIIKFLGFLFLFLRPVFLYTYLGTYPSWTVLFLALESIDIRNSSVQ